MDTINNEAFEIKAPCVVNTSGGWANRVLETAGLEAQRLQLSTAMNLVIKRRLLPERAAGVYGHFTHQLDSGPYHGRHVLFLAPWRRYTLAGTYHLPYTGDPEDMQVKEREIEDFLEEINSAIPGNKVQREEVSFFHKGFLPMDGVDNRTGEVDLTKHYSIVDHSRHGGPDGLITVIGVKYTTARDVSEKVASMVVRAIGRKKGRLERKVRLSGGDIDHMQAYYEEVSSAFDKWPETVMHHMIMQYGTGFREILDLTEKGDLAKTLPGSDEVLGAEIAYAVRNEMALTLKDVVLRRTDLGSGECPSDETLKACAHIMAAELGWNKRESDDQIAAVKAQYEPAKQG
jgi:glycerol-3-phosphate dehydrogenase